MSKPALTATEINQIQQEMNQFRQVRGSRPVIGFTEAGDAGLDLSWHDLALDPQNNIAGVVAITKGCYPKFQQAVLDCESRGVPITVHAGCTGWGGTPTEPNVVAPEQQIKCVSDLIDAGFPKERLVLRIDPIIPTSEGLARAAHVIELAYKAGILPACRVRFSIIDQYPHIERRFNARGIELPYPHGNKNPSQTDILAVAATLARFPLTFESCAETRMIPQCGHARFIARGCLSHEDFVRMGLAAVERTGSNNQHRFGCLCNSAKKELLTNKKPCGHNCAYCYWRDK